MIYQKVRNNKNSKVVFWSGIVGNSLDHYDSALYAFLAPFIAPIFFPESDPVVALILTYGIKSFGMFTRPAGALVFGNLARTQSVKKLLTITLIGVSLCTVCIGMIPGYKEIGIAAPCVLALLRAAQGFFAAGEHNIASLFILEQIPEVKKHGRASSYYLLSTMTGTLLASLAAWLTSISDAPELYWRIAFILGILTGIVGLFLRLNMHTDNISVSSVKKMGSLKVLSINKWKVLKIIPISSFTYITYAIPFIFLNNVAPTISNVNIEDLLKYSTILVIINNALIPIFGAVLVKYDVTKWMASLSAIFTISIIPLFAALPYFGLLGITIVKLWVIIIGVAFVTPLNAFLYKLSPGKEKYLVSGFGYAIGTELLGRNTTAICLFLWHWSNNLVVSAIYVALIAFLATICLVSEISSSKSEISA